MKNIFKFSYLLLSISFLFYLKIGILNCQELDENTLFFDNNIDDSNYENLDKIFQNNFEYPILDETQQDNTNEPVQSELDQIFENQDIPANDDFNLLNEPLNQPFSPLFQEDNLGLLFDHTNNDLFTSVLPQENLIFNDDFIDQNSFINNFEPDNLNWEKNNFNMVEENDPMVNWFNQVDDPNSNLNLYEQTPQIFLNEPIGLQFTDLASEASSKFSKETTSSLLTRLTNASTLSATNFTKYRITTNIPHVDSNQTLSLNESIALNRTNLSVVLNSTLSTPELNSSISLINATAKYQNLNSSASHLNNLLKNNLVKSSKKSIYKDSNGYLNVQSIDEAYDIDNMPSHRQSIGKADRVSHLVGKRIHTDAENRKGFTSKGR